MAVNDDRRTSNDPSSEAVTLDSPLSFPGAWFEQDSVKFPLKYAISSSIEIAMPLAANKLARAL